MFGFFFEQLKASSHECDIFLTVKEIVMTSVIFTCTIITRNVEKLKKMSNFHSIIEKTYLYDKMTFLGDFHVRT